LKKKNYFIGEAKLQAKKRVTVQLDKLVDSSRDFLLLHICLSLQLPKMIFPALQIHDVFPSKGTMTMLPFHFNLLPDHLPALLTNF
jgi:hypothetical protein